MLTRTKPFAGYDDFADCVDKNGDKGDPKAYCATIMNAVEKVFAPKPNTAWVGLYLSPADAARFTVPASVLYPGFMASPADEMHVTLLYYTSAPDPAAITRGMAGVFTSLREVTSVPAGVARFLPGEDGVPVVLLVDSPDLIPMRQAIADAIGAPFSRAHGFIPHVTYGYAQPGFAWQPTTPTPDPITFTTVSATINGIRHDWPLMP